MRVEVEAEVSRHQSSSGNGLRAMTSISYLSARALDVSIGEVGGLCGIKVSQAAAKVGWRQSVFQRYKLATLFKAQPKEESIEEPFLRELRVSASL